MILPLSVLTTLRDIGERCAQDGPERSYNHLTMLFTALSLTLAASFSPAVADAESGPWALLGYRTLAGPPTLANPVNGPITGEGQTLALVRWNNQLTLTTDVSFPVNGGTAVLNVDGVNHSVTGWWFTNMGSNAVTPIHGTWAPGKLAFYSSQSFKDRFHHVGYFGFQVTRLVDGSVQVAYGDLVSNKVGAAAQTDLQAGIGNFTPVETALFKGADLRMIRQGVKLLNPKP